MAKHEQKSHDSVDELCSAFDSYMAIRRHRAKLESQAAILAREIKTLQARELAALTELDTQCAKFKQVRTSFVIQSQRHTDV
jgi:hypothetical protein